MGPSGISRLVPLAERQQLHKMLSEGGALIEASAPYLFTVVDLIESLAVPLNLPASQNKAAPMPKAPAVQ